MNADLIIPVLNEEQSIGGVLDAVPKKLIRKIVVVDNGSNDDSSRVAKEKGAHVVQEPTRGYGQAFWAGVEYLKEAPPDVLVVIAGDGSDDPDEIETLIEPIEKKTADMVVGSRVLKKREHLMPVGQRLGNLIVPFLLRHLYNTEATDLGSSRALTWDAIKSLDLVDRGFGITVEMRIKAAKRGIRVVEVPVTHRMRTGGEQKISGTFLGTIKAGTKILYTIARYL